MQAPESHFAETHMAVYMGVKVTKQCGLYGGIRGLTPRPPESQGQPPWKAQKRAQSPPPPELA